MAAGGTGRIHKIVAFAKVAVCAAIPGGLAGAQPATVIAATPAKQVNHRNLRTAPPGGSFQHPRRSCLKQRYGLMA
jgi:hypothetical protein